MVDASQYQNCWQRRRLQHTSTQHLSTSLYTIVIVLSFHHFFTPVCTFRHMRTHQRGETRGRPTQEFLSAMQPRITRPPIRRNSNYHDQNVLPHEDERTLVERRTCTDVKQAYCSTNRHCCLSLIEDTGSSRSYWLRTVSLILVGYIPNGIINSRRFVSDSHAPSAARAYGQQPQCEQLHLHAHRRPYSTIERISAEGNCRVRRSYGSWKDSGIRAYLFVEALSWACNSRVSNVVLPAQSKDDSRIHSKES